MGTYLSDLNEHMGTYLNDSFLPLNKHMGTYLIDSFLPVKFYKDIYFKR